MHDMQYAHGQFHSECSKRNQKFENRESSEGSFRFSLISLMSSESEVIAMA